MAYVIEIPNAFEPTKGKRYRARNGITIRQWLEETYPGFTEFQIPTICGLNGKYVLRENWNTVLKENDVVQFIAVPTGPFIIIAVLVVLIALASFFLMPTPAAVTPGELPASDPVFSNKGQQNEIRLGEPIEVCYGRNRSYPSLASRPYYQYIDNDQYQHALYCLGQGYYEIHALQFGDTSIAEFEEVEYEVIPPGGAVTLFPTNVFTSAEAGGQEIFAPNEDDYVAPGWVGPFPANPAGTDAYQLQVDVIMPKGLYQAEDDGGIGSVSITVEIEYREIDDAGAPLGSFQAFTAPFPYVFTMTTTTPQRRTLSVDVAPGRYEVRMRRDVPKTISHKVGNTLVWEGLRSYLQDTVTDFGDVTLIAARVRATNNLNDRTQLKFNVISTRKLSVYESGGMSETPIATRSIVWAYVDAFRARYGGRIPDNFFDWDELLELDALYTYRGEYFDWIFRDPITVWETARTIARVGRATPLLVGSLITMRRDGPLELPVTLFNPDNIISGSFNWAVKLSRFEDHDSIRVEYTEPQTGYKQEAIIATIGSSYDNPKDVRIPGIQDRSHAYREGLYILASDRYLRENISFDTGLEGYIPVFGDLILVAHDVPKWSQTGFVVHAVRLDVELWQLYTSEPLLWEDGESYVLMFRGRQAEVLGPFAAQQTLDEKQVKVTIPESDFDFLLGGGNEPMLFIFGKAGQNTKLCKVVKIEPAGGEVIKVTCVNDAPIIHELAEQDPPGWTAPTLPTEPSAPVVQDLFLSQIDGPEMQIQAAWTAATGAIYYIVQSSHDDGGTWVERGMPTTTGLVFPGVPGVVKVRVAAVGDGQGPWLEGEIEILPIMALTLLTEWEALVWKVGWSSARNATGYTVRVYDNSESAPILERTDVQGLTPREFEYDLTDATSDGNLNRDMLVEVTPEYTDGSGAPTSLLLHNDPPGAPSNFSATQIGLDSNGDMEYRLEWDNPAASGDQKRVRIWLESASGFDPGVEAPYLDIPVTTPGDALVDEAFVSVPWSGSHPAYYWRIGVFDVWGLEIGANVSPEQTIPAFP